MRLVLLLLPLLLSAPLHAQTYSGPAEVIDGDSLSVSGFSVRLFGIDAPEGKQTCNRGGSSWRCGEEAATQLRNMIGGNPVECRGRSIDTYGRTVAICTVAGIELNKVMVEAGLATAFRKYALDYVTAETRAKAARRGIWDSEFDLPENYRAAHERPTNASPQAFSREIRPRPNASPSYSGCVIKGNRNRKPNGFIIYPVCRTTMSRARKRCTVPKRRPRPPVIAGRSFGSRPCPDRGQEKGPTVSDRAR